MKYLGDYHVHSSYSSDSNTPLESMILQGIKLGLKEITFTDHMDYNYPGQLLFLVDYDKYLEEFNQLKSKYVNQINIKLGVEIGLQPDVLHKAKELVHSYPFDFVLASTHIVNKQDPYTGDFFNHKTRNEAYEEYFREIYNMVTSYSDFDCYGHLDYVIRYSLSTNKMYDYHEFAHLLDDILKEIIGKDKGIEVNTSGFRKNLNHPHPQTQVLKRYKELGGEIITIGSDAHQPDELCHHFHETYKLLDTLGYKYITIFNKRKPEFIELSRLL